MAILTVKGVADFSGINEAIKSLQSTPINIKVKATGIDKVSQDTIKLINAQARLVKTEADLVQAQNSVVIATEKTKQARIELEKQTEKTATAEANLALQQEKTNTASKNLEVQQEKTRTATERYSKSAEEASKKTASLWDNIVKNAQWYLISGMVSRVTNAFKDAISTMKDVDDELVTVRKVTGFTAEEMEALEEQAYKTASAYGVAADEYLASVSAFARAGYKDQSEALAELATKTQLVGDTTADVAQQFLLSVDAAYQYNGNIEELTKVLDGANEIDNNYATSIEKIASGMGKIAPIAKQAHVGIDELAAAIGTVTAVTQRTGTEAATSLRALFLNILGDTKTEIDEGVTWTTGEIAGLRDVIKIYAKDVYDAAQASGEVINPMEAIAALSQSMKDGLLTEAQLMEMVSDIGGKLRTSDLLAIIQNWDMYESMLADFQDAAGSADAEIENMMDSWSRKVEVLKNTWTEFISKTIDTEWIKGLLDGLTWLIEGFDNLGTVLLAVSAIFSGKIVTGLVGWGKKLVGGLTSLGKALGIVKLKAGEAVSGLTAFNAALGIVTVAITAAVFAYNKYQQKLEEATEEAAEAAEKANETAESIVTLNGKFATAEEGSDAYKEALKELSGVLGEDMPDSADAAIAKLKELTEEELDAAQTAAFAAKAAAGRQLESDILGIKSIPSVAQIRTGDAAADNQIVNVLGSVATLTAGKTYSSHGVVMQGSGRWQPTEYTAEGLSEYYDALVKVKNMTEEVAAKTQDATILEQQGYLDVIDKISELEDNGISAYKAAEQQELQAQALKRVQADIQSGLYDTQEAYDAQIEKVKENTEWTEEETEAYLKAAQDALPRFAEATDEAADGTDDNTDALKANIAEVDKLAKKLSGLTDAFADLDENGKLSYDTLSDIYDRFSDLEGIEAYITALSDADLTADELNQILGIMTEQLILQKIAAGELTAADETLIARMLEAAGVENALQVAHALAALSAADAAKATGAISTALGGLNGASIDASGIIGAFAGIAGSAQAAAESVANLRNVLSGQEKLSQIATSYTGLDASTVSRNIQAFIKKREKLGYSHEEAVDYAARYYTHWDPLTNKRRSTPFQFQQNTSSYDVESLIAELTANIPSYGGISYSGGGGGSSSSSTSDPMLTALEHEVSLLESELSLMEQQGKSTDELNKKRREIQEALHTQAEYLRSIGGDQVDINKLSIEWWQIQHDILDTQEDSVALEEKKADLIKRQNDLLEAQRERVVRVYNAQTKQWEWVADAGNVQSAQEAYEEALKEYKEAGGTDTTSLLSGVGLDGSTGLLPVSAGLLSAAGVTSAAQYSNSAVTTNNNGDTYNIGGVSLTREQAETTTVAELARLARNLGVQNAV